MISMSSIIGEPHSFIQQPQAHVTLGGSWHHEAELWVRHSGPNLNCQKCLYSCRRILSFFSLLSFNKSTESSVSSGFTATADLPHRLQLIFDVACIDLHAFREAIHFQTLFFHNPMNAWKEEPYYSDVPEHSLLYLSATHQSGRDLYPPGQKQVEWRARLLRPPLCLRGQPSPAES